jgi:hypothetical protein
MHSSLLRILALVVVAASLPAQTLVLNTTVQGGTGQKGNMFDLVNTSGGPLSIIAFSQNFLSGGTANFEVYTKTGSYAGSETVPANWTLQLSVSNLVHGASGTLVPIPGVVAVTIPAGATQAFYLTTTSATTSNVAYTVGTNVPGAPVTGAVAYSDANLQFLCGIGNAYPFGGVLGGPTPGGQGRVWNGSISYVLGNMPPANYQTNSSSSSLLVNGVGTNGYTPPVVTSYSYVCPTGNVSATGNVAFASTALGMPWDIVLSPANLVSVAGGAVQIPAGIINLDITQPLGFVNNFFGSNLPNFTFPGVTGASMTWAFTVSASVNTSMQAMVINPASSAGASLSQATEFHCVVQTGPAPSVAGPTGDDTSVLINFTTPQVCWPSIPMYGTLYTQMQVVSNGRVLFQSATNTDWTPTIAEAQATTSGPFIGFWTDLNPSLVTGGAVTASQPAPGLLRVDYVGVAYDQEPTATVTFGIQFDTITGMVQLDGLTGIVANPQLVFAATSDSQYFGMSRGSGATDGGITTFTAGGSALALSPTAMIYDWYGAVVGGAGRVNSLVPGTLNTIVFTPSVTAAPNYNWAGF